MIKANSSFFRKIPIFLFFCIFLPALPVFAEEDGKREKFWISPGAEVAMFSISNVAYGGGLSLGYGNRASIGLKAAWFFDGNNEVNTLELAFLFRWYFLNPSSRLFIQFNGGPAFFIKDDSLFDSSESGVISAGLAVGWRHLFGKYWFVEGSIRAGYPYIAGIGVYSGIQF